MGNSWVAPGVRCVCIRDDWEELVPGLPSRQPMIGEVLTIKSARLGRGGNLGGDPNAIYLTFWEVDERQEAGGIAVVIRWVVDSFKPIVEQQTDISTLTALLQPARELADV